MREKCVVDNCDNIATLRHHKEDGVAVYRKKCSKHHRPNKKKKHSKGRVFNYRKILLSLLGGKCVVCNVSNKLELHHIVPVALGGKDEFENLKLLCQECHYKAHWSHLL